MGEGGELQPLNRISSTDKFLLECYNLYFYGDKSRCFEVRLAPKDMCFVNNRVTVEISSLPFRIGVRQLDIPAYPSRPFYMFDFNDYKLEDRVKGRLEDENDVNAIQDGVEAEKSKIRQKMPIKVTIERDINEDIELLTVAEIIDKEGTPVNRNFFNLQVQSMSEVDNFWLDSGIFSLNINNSQI